MKSALVKFDEENQKRLNKYQAGQELETGVRPNYSEVFLRGLECLGSVKKQDRPASDSESARIAWLSEENVRLDGQIKALRGANDAWKTENEKLKAERGPEKNPSLFAEENNQLKKQIVDLKTDRDKWKASAETFRAKLAPGLKTAGDLASERETATNYLKK